MALTPAELDAAQAQINAARDQTHTNIDLAEGWAEIARQAASASGSGSAQTATAEANRAAAQKVLAVEARVGAETAKGLAETAKTGADTARSGAETARTGAETARGKAEEARDRAEAVPGAVDTLLPTLLGNPASGTRVALDGVYAPLPKMSVNPLTGRVHAPVAALVGTTTDAAPVLNAAANAARAAKAPLDIPEGRLFIDSTVDMRYLNVDSFAEIVMRHTNGPGVVIGDTSVQRNARRIDLRWVRHDPTPQLGWDWPHPAVRVVGLKGAFVNIGNCSLLELFADGAVSTDTSIAYNNFACARVNHLRLHGVNGQGWINQNLFLGGSYNRITLSGSYGHNNNKWVLPSVEGADSLLDLQVGAQNVFEDARAEGGTKVKFGVGTWRNTVSALYTSNPSVLDAFEVQEDLGNQNIVTSRDLAQMTPHTVLKVDATTPLLDVAGLGLTPDTLPSLPIPSVGGGRLSIRSANRYFLDTGKMKIEEVRATATTNRTLNPLTRIKRLLLSSDQAILRPYLYGYDENGVQIDPTVTPFMDEYAGWAASAANGGGYGFSTPVASAAITIFNPAVKYLRLRLTSSVTGLPLFSHITLTAYVESAVAGHVVESMRQQVRGTGDLFGAAKPAEGLVGVGTVVAGVADSWKAVARVDTTLTAAASTATLTVSSGTGIAVGDVIGVLLSTGRTHWSTVTAVSGTTVTIAAALPTPAASGAAVGTVRWAVVAPKPALVDLPEVQTALNGKVTNKGGATGLWVGTVATRPTTGEVGVLYVTTD